MISISRTISLDEMVRPEALQGYTFSAEDRGHKFIISCTSQGEPYALSGSITARFKRANNTTVLLGGAIESGAATVILSGDCYNVPGGFRLTIYNTVDGVTTCIYWGEGTVIYSSNGELIDSGNIVPSLDDVVEEMEAVRAATDAANNAAALASSTAVAFGPYNAFDILAGCSKPTRTVNGITFSWSGNKIIIDGTFPSGATNQSASTIAFNSANSFPFGMKPGMTIRLASDISPVWVYIGFYKDGDWSSNQFIGSAARQIQIPSDATGVRLGVGVSTAYEQSPDYGHAEAEVAILSSDVMTNAELKSADDEMKNAIQHTFPAHGASDGGTRFSSDLNNLDEEGTYILEGNTAFANSPYNSAMAGGMLLIVYPVVRTYGYQPTATMHQVIIYVRENAIWIRSRSSGVWSSWGLCSLPIGPSSDGTYTLKCTVSNNALTYTWVRD